MFKQNTAHLQSKMFGLLSSLPEAMQKHAKESEEYCFYQIIFCNINEKIFAPLFSDIKSRPNASINAMVSALMLLNRNQWTYKKLFKEVEFNILTKIALGIDELEYMPFCEATLFNFQNRLNDHFIKTGENLLELVFDGLTEKQIKALKLKTNIQRTDSFLAASNIRNYSRLQLLIEMIIRIYRVLSEEDKTRFAEQFKEYVKRSSGQYLYGLSSSDFPHEFEKIGQLYQWIEENLLPLYAPLDIFKTFMRVYMEHFLVTADKVELKPSEQMTSDMIQSPDDLDATYRDKNGKVSKGQVINIVETAHPDNPLNLITDVAVNANNKDDSVVLQTRLDNLIEKTPELAELHFDGGYGSFENDEKMEQYGIAPVQTAVRGIEPAVQIKIDQLSDGHYQVTCPLQTVKSKITRKQHKAMFDISVCQTCCQISNCPALQRKTHRVYYFTYKDFLRKKRHQTIMNIPVARRKLRSNVEATIQEFSCRMRNGKLKVRGYLKACIFAFSTALGINFGRIFRYLSNNPDKFRSFFIFVRNIFKEQLLRLDYILEVLILTKFNALFVNY